MVQDIAQVSASAAAMLDSLQEPELLGTALESAIDDKEPLLGYQKGSVDAYAPAAVTGEVAPGTATPEQRFRILCEAVASYSEKEDLELISRAYHFAAAAHEGQCRKSGEPFVAHPMEVALILSSLRMDAEAIAAALLHDTVEDTEVTVEQLADIFGEAVAQLVDGVTKITRIEVENISDEQAQTYRKMFVAMSNDIRVVIIKLADRLHNMRTLGALREDRRIFKSRETLEIYAPIAHRLGISSIKWELEDLSFFYLEPNKCKQVARMVMESRADREAYLSQVMSILQAEVDRMGIACRIEGRPKHLYSIYEKMTQRGKGFSEIYDLIAVRIIVKDIKDCYSALGAVHTLWHPMPGRFKDYIAMPKDNMYQSLHTTVIGPAARPLEVQIRTEEMHARSEYGIAAHWRYKEKGATRGDLELDKQLAWLREMVDWADETQDSREFLKSLKVDLAPTEVFVFTPKGEVKSLRAGSTPIDFAYAIHTEVGNHCVGAKVNGSIVPLSYQVQNGDRIEILTQKSATPSRDWLNLVKTPSARSKIRAYHSRISRSDDLQLGRDKLIREVKRLNTNISNALLMRVMQDVAKQLGFNDPDDMLVQIGSGKESTQHVANRVIKVISEAGAAHDTKDAILVTSATKNASTPPMLTVVKPQRKKKSHSSSGVVVKGLDDAPVRLSHCCNPMPGDDILGFVTRGRGISVHRADCPNAIDLKRSPERLIEVSWAQEMSNAVTYEVELELEATDRANLLLDVTQMLSECGAFVLSFSSNTGKDNMVSMRFRIQVSEISFVDIVLKKLRSVRGVFDAHRMIAGSQSSKRKNKK
ncbi:MAG: bifunctional (p)ppGpp synthetase/guanosine-3',5'-bis(diphosphate) 3'-pyrophosphohydrolase [Eggerthellales bacterium]|nr:bifunctional (p)ppGpp synthetase/guanosine-3',5'-bis(diphosphate) 3'-pyrophosphohydrolase [Eggerthellales bacterium]